MGALITRKTSLPEHIIQFIRFLRTKGYTVSAHEEIEILSVLKRGVPKSYGHQRLMFKSILVKSRQQFLTFGELYDDYWTQLSRAEDGKVKTEKRETNVPKPSRQKSDLQALKNWLYNRSKTEEKEVAYHSALEAISQQDFSAFKTDEHKDLIEVIRLIAKKITNRRSRRNIRSFAKREMDVKATIREAMRKGMEVHDFRYKEKKINKVNLILICDVSKSMELYSKFLIEFMYGFNQLNLNIKTFVFSTRLISLTSTLADGNFDKVLSNLSVQVPYWSSGTRIGESLSQFKNNHAEKLLNNKSMVLVLSDGLDTGDLSELETTMRFLQKKSSRLIWMNPLAGQPNFKVETKAMKLALPYIDLFTSAHNLESLKKVAMTF